jgi:hypothetical protein
MGKRRLAVVCAAALMGVCANGALAGEVKGPPTGGTPTSNDTAAPAHANSICAFSGLNDYNNGQKVSQVQTAADSFKYYGDPHGTPGTACRGGSNPDNPPG